MNDALLYTGVAYAVIHVTASLRTIVHVTQATGGFPAVDPRAPQGSVQILTRWGLCILLGPFGWLERVEKRLGIDEPRRVRSRQCGFCTAGLLSWQSVCQSCFSDLSLRSPDALPGLDRVRLVSEASRRMAARDCTWKLFSRNLVTALMVVNLSIETNMLPAMLPEVSSLALMWNLAEAFSVWRDRKGLLLARFEQGVLVQRYVPPTPMEIVLRFSFPVSFGYVLGSCLISVRLGSSSPWDLCDVVLLGTAITWGSLWAAYPAWKLMKERCGNNKTTHIIGS